MNIRKLKAIHSKIKQRNGLAADGELRSNKVLCFLMFIDKTNSELV